MYLGEDEGHHNGATIHELHNEAEEVLFTGKCFECKQVGHFARDCHKSAGMRQTIQKGNTSSSNSSSANGRQVAKYEGNKFSKKPYQSGTAQAGKPKFNRTRRDLIKKGKLCQVCKKGGHKYENCFYFKRAKAAMQSSTEPSQRNSLYAVAMQDPYDDQLDHVAEYVSLALESRPEVDAENIFTNCVNLADFWDEDELSESEMDEELLEGVEEGEEE